MSRCLFVPPYVLQTLADRTDDPDFAGLVRHTLDTDTAIRAHREHPVAPPPASEDERPRRTVYTADNTSALPGRPVRHEGEPATGDPAADEAYDGVGSAWSLYNHVYGRDSFDDAGHPIDATVHYERDYPNAFWNGTRLVFGDGDGRVFRRFTSAPDVIAHEFAHGVTQHTSGFVYSGQSGALNESVSDVFAALTVQRALGQDAEEATWLIGEQIFAPGVQAKALRSMKAPGTAYDDPQIGTDPQPSTMAGYVETTDDNGGVHINSGIPNHAFYLAATTLGGPAWEHVGAVWFDALTDPRVDAHTDFARWAAVTAAVARLMFPDRAEVAEAVQQAWADVGVARADLGADVATTTTTRTSPRPTTRGRAVRVRRTGGVAGTTLERSVDTATSAEGPRIEQLLGELPAPEEPTTATPQPDRFVFAIDVDGRSVHVLEPDLTPGLSELIDLVLRREP